MENPLKDYLAVQPKRNVKSLVLLLVQQIFRNA